MAVIKDTVRTLTSGSKGHKPLLTCHTKTKMRKIPAKQNLNDITDKRKMGNSITVIS